MKKIFPLSSTHRRGQSLVELGLFMMALLLLLAGAVNFGLAFFDYVAIRDAAQEGALFGSIMPATNSSGTPNTSGITTRVRGTSLKPVDMSDAGEVTVTVTFDGTARQTCPGHKIVVEVEYDSPVVMPILGVFTNTIHLTAEATSAILKSSNTSCSP